MGAKIDGARFGKNINLAIARLGMDLRDLERESKVPRRTLSHYAEGKAKRSPNPEHLAALATALQITPEALLGSSPMWGSVEAEEAELGHEPIRGAAKGSLGLLSGSAEGQTFDIAMAAGEFIDKWCAAFGVKPSRRAQIAMTAAAISTFMHYDVDSPVNLPSEVLGDFTKAMLKKYRNGELD